MRKWQYKKIWNQEKNDPSLIIISSSFHSLFKVLFTFPSRYLFAISFLSIFSLGWRLPPMLELYSQTVRLFASIFFIPFDFIGTGLSPFLVSCSKEFTIIPLVWEEDKRFLYISFIYIQTKDWKIGLNVPVHSLLLRKS